MVKKIRILFLFVALFFLMVPLAAYGANSNLVYDQAGLFSSEEIQEFQLSLEKMKQDYGMDFILVTTDNAQGKSAKDYADDFYDGIYGPDHDGAIFYIDMDNREIRVSASGKAIDYLTDYRKEKILDVAIEGMKKGNYADTARAFIFSTAKYMAQGIPENQHRQGVKNNTLSSVEAAISFLVGGGIGAGYFRRNKKIYKGTPTPNNFGYRKNSSTNFGIVTDNLFNSYTTSRTIPRNTGGGGGDSGVSSTYTSSSGGTHSSSGRGF